LIQQTRISEAMSSFAPEASQLENNKDKPAAVNSDYDNKKSTAEPTRRKPSAMTRRLSFSMTRPWSSYAENYSSCLSGLRRNSSEQLIKRQGSLQSSPTSSSSDLSKSLDSGQLRNLKATTPDSEVKPRTSKISAMHARPFHQRRWSSPVVFSVAKLAVSSHKASKQFKGENGSGETLQDCKKDKDNDKICETDEIILSQEQAKTCAPVSIAQVCVENQAPKSKATEEAPNDSPNFTSGQTTSLSPHVAENSNNKEEKEVGKPEPAKMNSRNQPRSGTNDKTNSDALPESSEVKKEDPTQNRNIYTEIKKNTRWSKSKRFRRRHHTIHADSHRFINPKLFTIAEQSSGSFGSVAGANERYNDRVMNGKLISRRSKSLGDLNTLPDDMKTNGVSVQQLCAKPICVSVAINKNKNEGTASTRDTTVTYKGEEKSESASKRQISCPVQVNIQTFNQIQITPGVEEQRKPQASKTQPYYSTQQHVVFTQPKAKWTSITISQV
jgi:hypothetical protein